MEKVKIDPTTQAYRLLNPGVVLLISVGDGVKDNLYPVTWNMPLKKEPGMIAILSGKGHFSYPLIAKTGEFGANVPGADLVDAVYGCGSTSGYVIKDKFSRFGLTREKAEFIYAPLVKEAVAHMECRVCQVVDLGNTALLMAIIMKATVDPRHFRDSQWIFDNGLELLHHVGGTRFAVSKHAVTAKEVLNWNE